MSGTLVQMADEMRAALVRREPPCAVTRTLGHGLILVLERKDESRWRLGLGRTNVMPSQQEALICRAAFGVPAGPQQVNRTQQRLTAERTEIVQYHIIEFFWREYAKADVGTPGVGGDPVGADLVPADDAAGGVGAVSRR